MHEMTKQRPYSSGFLNGTFGRMGGAFKAATASHLTRSRRFNQ